MKSFRKPVTKKIAAPKGCEPCLHRGSDFTDDPEHTGVIRCYCRVRHVNVDVSLMSFNCDFYTLDPHWTSPLKAEEGI